MERNSLDDISSMRGGFMINPPGTSRIPRTRIGTNTGLPPAQELPTKEGKSVPESDLRTKASSKTQTKTKGFKQPTARATKTAQTKSSPSRQKSGRSQSRATTVMSAGRSWVGGYGGKPPGSPEESGQPGDSFPTGEVEYLGGPRVTTQTSKFDGISEIDQLDQTAGSWTGDPSQVRTLYQSFNFQPYPNYGGAIAGMKSSGATTFATASTTQDEIFLDTFGAIQQEYSENYNANTVFEQNFKPVYFYYYQFDVNRLHAEYVCLLQRAAYYQSTGTEYTENACAEKIANVLNTTNFYPIRNKMARALKRQFIDREMRDKHYEIFQTNRLTPHETGGTIFNVTDAMATLLQNLSNAADLATAQNVVATYIAQLDTMCDYLLYGRPIQTDTSVSPSKTIPDYMIPKREFSGTLYNLYTGSDPDTIYSTVRRNAMSAILDRVSGSRGSFDYVKLNYQARGNSMSLYDSAFCDRYNNTPNRNGSTFYPTMLKGSTTVSKAALSASPYYCSERSADNQDCDTVFHMLLMFNGESPLYYSNSRITSFTTREYFIYRGRNSLIGDENIDLAYTAKGNITQVGSNAFPPIQDNYVTKTYFDGSNIYGFSAPDGDSSPLYFVTYGRVIEKFKQKYMVNK
uniref:Capsid protein n=1 Tax=viral metagenome TaxID=1070528 RepID=A0A2V0RBX6_9ZZZZ